MFPIWVNDGTTEMPEDPIFYVVAKDGIYLKKSMGHFDTISKVDGISILGECESFAVLHIAKIPVRKFAQIVGLFRAVYHKYHSEVNAILHYNIKRKRFRIDIPPQGVSGASVEYQNGLETYKGYTRIGTIHSHASMSAFHSGTDQHDEEGWDGLHITLGKMNQEYFDISCSVMSNKERFMVNPVDYIEGVELTEYEPVSKYQSYRYVGGVREEIKPQPLLGWKVNTVEKDFIFPKKWMEQVDKFKPRPIIGASVFGVGAGAIGRGSRGNFNSLNDFYTYHQQLDIPRDGRQQAHTNSHIFNDDTFEVDQGEWSPCAQCPYRNHKSDILMKEIMEEAAAEEELLADDLAEEIAAQNNLDGIVYDPEVERRSPFYVDDKETPLGASKDKRKE